MLTDCTETLFHIIKQKVMQVSFGLALKRPFQKRLFQIRIMR